MAFCRLTCDPTPPSVVESTPAPSRLGAPPAPEAPLGRRLASQRHDPDRIPLDLHPKTSLERLEQRLRLADAETAADAQLQELRVGDHDLRLRIAADLGDH